MSDVLPDEANDTELYVACPACVSFVSIDSRDNGSGKAEQHNDRAHDGHDRARTVNTRDMEELSTFLAAVKEHSPGDQYENLINQMHNGNAAFFCSAAIFEEVVPDEDWY